MLSPRPVSCFPHRSLFSYSIVGNPPQFLQLAHSASFHFTQPPVFLSRAAPPGRSLSLSSPLSSAYPLLGSGFPIMRLAFTCSSLSNPVTPEIPWAHLRFPFSSNVSSPLSRTVPFCTFFKCVVLHTPSAPTQFFVSPGFVIFPYTYPMLSLSASFAFAPLGYLSGAYPPPRCRRLRFPSRLSRGFNLVLHLSCFSSLPFPLICSSVLAGFTGSSLGLRPSSLTPCFRPALCFCSPQPEWLLLLLVCTELSPFSPTVILCLIAAPRQHPMGSFLGPFLPTTALLRFLLLSFPKFCFSDQAGFVVATRCNHPAASLLPPLGPFHICLHPPPLPSSSLFALSSVTLFFVRSYGLELFSVQISLALASAPAGRKMSWSLSQLQSQWSLSLRIRSRTILIPPPSRTLLAPHLLCFCPSACLL